MQDQRFYCIILAIYSSFISTHFTINWFAILHLFISIRRNIFLSWTLFTDDNLSKKFFFWLHWNFWVNLLLLLSNFDFFYPWICIYFVYWASLILKRFEFYVEFSLPFLKLFNFWVKFLYLLIDLLDFITHWIYLLLAFTFLFFGFDITA